jgi:hypothetical protein
MALRFEITRIVQECGEEHLVFNVYDESVGHRGSGGRVTNAVSTCDRTKVYGALLDIGRSLGGCAGTDDARKLVARLWSEHGLHKQRSL